MTNAREDRVTEGREQRQHAIDTLEIDESTAYTFSAPEKREAYVEKLESQVATLKSVMDRMVERGADLETSARKDFERRRGILQNRYDTVKARLDEVRRSGDEAWKELRQGTETAWYDLAGAVRSAVEKFRP